MAIFRLPLSCNFRSAALRSIAKADTSSPSEAWTENGGTKAMRIVIEQSDFRELSPEAQREIIQKFAGDVLQPAAGLAAGAKLRWRQPVDLNEDMAARLCHGLSESHKRRLELFAKKGHCSPSAAASVSPTLRGHFPARNAAIASALRVGM
ncbi:MAG: hypothetical protein R3285_10880, partial [Kiloniellales bacterium]|nr:hypothetical protein [Kiloniellales bacterium]